MPDDVDCSLRLHDDVDSYWSPLTCPQQSLPGNRSDATEPDLRLVESLLELGSLHLRILCLSSGPTCAFFEFPVERCGQQDHIVRRRSWIGFLCVRTILPTHNENAFYFQLSNVLDFLVGRSKRPMRSISFSQSEDQTWHDAEDWLSLNLQYLATTSASPLIIDGQAERLS
jgi:hypothetical protein